MKRRQLLMAAASAPLADAPAPVKYTITVDAVFSTEALSVPWQWEQLLADLRTELNSGGGR